MRSICACICTRIHIGKYDRSVGGNDLRGNDTDNHQVDNGRMQEECRCEGTEGISKLQVLKFQFESCYGKCKGKTEGTPSWRDNDHGKKRCENKKYTVTVIPAKKSDVRLNQELILSGQNVRLKLVSDKYDTSQVKLYIDSAFKEIDHKGNCNFKESIVIK